MAVNTLPELRASALDVLGADAAVNAAPIDAESILVVGGEITQELEAGRKVTLTGGAETLYATSRKGESIINLLSISAWSILAVVSFVVMLLTLLLFLFGKSVSTKKTGFIIALFSLFITIFANLSALHRYHYLTERNDAVIMESSVTAKSTPSNSGTELFVIHEGRKVKISDDSMREWTEIELEDGNKGWIPSSSLERI